VSGRHRDWVEGPNDKYIHAIAVVALKVSQTMPKARNPKAANVSRANVPHAGTPQAHRPQLNIPFKNNTQPNLQNSHFPHPKKPTNESEKDLKLSLKDFRDRLASKNDVITSKQASVHERIEQLKKEVVAHQAEAKRLSNLAREEESKEDELIHKLDQARGELYKLDEMKQKNQDKRELADDLSSLTDEGGKVGWVI